MIYFIFLFYVTFVTATQNATGLIGQAVSLASRYYNLKLNTYLVWNDDSEEVKEFIIQYPGAVVLNPLYDCNNSLILSNIPHFGYSQTVFFATAPEEFDYFMQLISDNLIFPIRVILILNKSANENLDLSTFMEIAWRNNLADIVILNKQMNEDIVNLFTYFPYRNGVCGNNRPVQLKTDENMFPIKFNDFNGCIIRVSARHHAPLVELEADNTTVISFGGYDATVVKVIAETLNASIDVLVLTRYGYCVNGTANGGFQDLLTNKSDIIIPSGVKTLGRHLVTQATHAYYDGDSRWIGPRRRPMYRWNKLFIPFFNNVSLLLLLAYALFVIVTSMIKKFIISRRDKQGSLCFRAFSLLVGQTVTFMTKVPLLNNLFLVWIWFCFIIRIEYQGSLVNSFQNNNLEPPFGPIEDAVNEVDGFGGMPVYFDYYVGTALEQGFLTMRRPNFSVYLDKLVQGERYLLVSDSFLFQRVRNSVQILNEPITSSLSCLFMRPGWPAAEAVDTVVVRLTEAGIMEHILNRKHIQKNRHYKETYALNVSMVSSCFYAMGAMWCICFITFMIEIIYYNHTKTKTRGNIYKINH